ncbi:hypothetical protein HY745_11310, partial [Candidatus Desantisbacteria bacterium]|nr:hypothetical protein [Candidatus Desantisbacteria bacterium]
KEDGQEITIAGIISNISLKSTKKGDRMAILTLEDLKGTIEVVLFPEKYRINTEHIREDAIIFVKGRVDTTGENPKIIGNEIIPVDEIKKQLLSRFHIKLNTVGLEESDLIDMKNLIVKNKGKCAVYLHFFDTHGKETIVRAASNYLVNPTDNFINAMEKLAGEESIWFSD